MKKTIVILSHYSENGAPFCSYTFSHARALVGLGNRVIVLVISGFFPFIKPKKERQNRVIDGVEIRYFNTISFSNFFYNSKLNLNAYSYYLVAKRQLKKILKEEKVDLIDAHTFKIEGYAAYLLKKKFNIKTFVTLHGTSFNRNLGTKNGIEQIKKVGNGIDLYICVSDKIANQLKSLRVLNNKTIYNGCEFVPVKRNNDNYNICTVASFTAGKNIDLVIKAFKQIKEKHSQSKLFIIGKGQLEKKLKTLTEALNLEKSVIFTGFLTNTDVFKYLSNSKVFILPSSPEGFGISYVEAMYCGCITVGTKNEGIDGFIKDGENGFLINPDVDSICKIMDYIINNNCDTIKERGIEKTRGLTWQKNAESYMSLK